MWVTSRELVLLLSSIHKKEDYSNLAIAYMLARDIALNAKEIELDKDILAMIVNRIIKDINEILTIKISSSKQHRQ